MQETSKARATLSTSWTFAMEIVTRQMVPTNSAVNYLFYLTQSHGAATRWKEGNGSGGERILITPLGRLLAELPVELSIGRVLVMASLFRLVEPVLTLATGMAVQSPVGAARSGESRLRQTEAIRPFENDHGTPFMIADLFDEWLQVWGNPDCAKLCEFEE